MFRGVDCEVAIKLFKQEKGTSYEAICKDVEVEASTIQEISDRLMNKDVTIKLFGIVEGKLTKDFTEIFEIPEGIRLVGLVMHYEGGGDLESLIHPPITAGLAGAGLRRSMDIKSKLSLL